jgi:hypothetical protein
MSEPRKVTASETTKETGKEHVQKQEHELANEKDGNGKKDPKIAEPPHNTHDGKPAK